ncbi:heavy metal translocating P-type ATPase [Methanobrevibacter olleyae]|uniref:Heavy metal translocating P-type ATPase n=1 Tax=Methanobrevibacter olleyae TaxID=294671 RepID=A0A126R2W2_METOL|nr:heavy metal translocating P-type ATPase [Methanobrevibacter olleyae]AMK16378.1 heavy metal translocating P-type ATPase [Methanobrevibacter olleyae]
MAKEKELSIPVDGMHCSSCSLLVEKSLAKLDEVESINVDLNTNKANMVLNDNVSPDIIDEAVESVGFTVPKDEVVIKIDGMHCASCVNNVEKFLPRVEGVVEANANLSNQKVTIKYYRDILNLKEIQKTIEMLGFEYIGLDGELDIMDEEERYQKDLRGKLYRIIVGLVFAAILMLIMHFHYTIPPLTLGQLSLIIAIFPFYYVSYPILKAGWNSFKHKNLDMDVMYSMGILVAFVSSVLGTFNIVLDSSFMFYESAVMLPSFLTIGRYLEARAKRKTSSSIKELIGLQPKTATLITTDSDGNTVEKEIDIEEINIGDILLVKPGEKIPADSIVVEGESYVDEAMITGEPVPKLKKAGIDLFSGTINQDGALKIEAQKIGSETVLSQIIDLVEKAQGTKPPVQRLANKIVSWFIPVILTIAIIVFCLWYFVAGAGLLFALTCLISVLVVACPCSLGLATPTAVTVGVGRAAEYGILIKNGETLESSQDVDVVVFDKTGTITEGKPEVEDIETFDMEESKFLQILSTVENNSNHPIAKSILNRFKLDNIQLRSEGREDLSLLDLDDFENLTGKGLKANVTIDREIKPVLAGNLKLMEAEGVFVSEEVLNKFDTFVSQAKTTIVMAVNGEIKGIITLMDKIKSNSKHTIDALDEMGIETYMLTGDNEKTASTVANSVGIDNVMANVLPNDKLDKVSQLQKEGKRVLFVGDGINDAPALSQADVGVAMGNGTDIAMESGDIVVMEGDLENVVASIQFSQKVMTRIKENLFWAFAYNMLLVPAAAGLLFLLFDIVFRPEWAGLAMALSSVTVISLSLLLKRYIPPIKRQSN